MTTKTDDVAKVWTSDEMQALFAAMGGWYTEPTPEEETP